MNSTIQSAFLMTEAQLDAELRIVGFSDDRLSTMPLDYKQILVKDGAVQLISSTEVNGPLDKGETDGIGVSPRGTITDASLRGILDKVELASSGGKKRYKISFDWTWADDTTVNLADKVGISYNI